MVAGSDILTIVLAVISLLLLIGGIVLLVRSIKSTIRKKKRIGGIIGAVIMITFSFIIGAFGLFFLFVWVVSSAGAA